MEGLKVGITKKEIAARAVLRDVWQSGHRCVELRQDGRAFIFFCSLCSTRCYNDSTLVDHLRGNQHARRLSSASISSSQPFATEEGLTLKRDQVASASKGKSMNESSTVLKSNLIEPFPASSLEWIGSGKILLEEGLSEKQVQQVWCEWHGRNEVSEASDAHTGKKSEDLAQALVVFPYSDAIGRQGEWRPGCFVKKGENLCFKEKLRFSEIRRRVAKNSDVPSLSSQDSQASSVAWKPPSGEEEGTCSFTLKDLSQRALLKALKRRKLNVLERLCFICHQQMLPGRDVAALLNLSTGQMMCSSRNERGAFHVFHTSCLIDWVLLCESKFWSARTVKKDSPRMRGQINKKPRRGKARATIQSCGPLFCPECQGTGIDVRGHQLEQPRYRIVQVFDWILELIQARRWWTNHPELQYKKFRGLLFFSEAHYKNIALSLGSLEFYAAGSVEFLASAASTRLLPHGA